MVSFIEGIAQILISYIFDKNVLKVSLCIDFSITNKNIRYYNIKISKRVCLFYIDI